jgi:tRNA dimethylallyltransferase
MLKGGLVDEVRRLQQMGLTSDDPVLSAIGYRQIAEYLEGKTDFEVALREIRRATRQLVRRQANWFRADDPRITWLDATPDVGDTAAHIIEDWLAGRYSSE